MFKTASKDQQESKVQLFHHCHMIFSGTICKKKCQMKGHTDLGDNSDFEERWSGCERRPKTKAEFFFFSFFYPLRPSSRPKTSLFLVEESVPYWQRNFHPSLYTSIALSIWFFSLGCLINNKAWKGFSYKGGPIFYLFELWLERMYWFLT